MGTAAINMEKRADREIREGKTEAEVIRSDIGNINRQIKEHNKFVRELKAKLDEMAEKAKDFVEEVAKKLEAMRAKLIGNRYEETVLTKKHKQIESVLAPEAEVLEKYQIEMQKVEEANRYSTDEIKRLNKELKECSPFQIKKKSEIQKQIQEEQGNIEHRTEYMQGIARMCQLPTEEDFKNATKKHSKRVDDCEKLGRTIEAIKEDSEQITVEYQVTVQAIPEESRQAVREKRAEERPDAETVLKDKLSTKHGETLDEDILEVSKKAVDKVVEPAEKINELIDVNEKVITKTHHH